MRVSIRPVVSTLVTVGAVLAADAAHADVVYGPCTEGALDCSSGAATLHKESRDPVMTSIGTGWMPACTTPDAQGHCPDENPIQVRASIDLAAIPSPSTEPLWMVDMGRGAVVDARWPSKDAFDLTVPTAREADGTFKVSHTLIPQVHVFASFFGLISTTWTYSTAQFLSDYAANYNYKATKTVSFSPWAIETPVVNLVPSPALSTTTLLDVTLIKDADNDVHLALAAKTSPEFTYRTTKVTLGSATPISADEAIGKLPMVDADFLELEARVEGEIKVKGELVAAPYVKIKKMFGLSIPGSLGELDLSGAVNAPKQQYNAAPPVAVKFPPVMVHIPLPNLKAPTSAVDLGSVQIGQHAEQSVTIVNTGELGAAMGFTSSDPQFSVIDSAGADPKKDYALAVRFTPTKEGPQSATITMTSNDPDSPVQSFEVHANGTPAPVPPPPATGSGTEEPEEESRFAPRDESGCGCRTVPAGTSYHALAGLGVAGLLLARRRRARS